jgi:hypothetical protein
MSGDVQVMAHRSRWGFHPCDLATWRRLRRLRLLWFGSLRRLAAWQRWNHKLPHNRVIRRRVRGADGRPIGWEVMGPCREPAVPEFAVREQWGRRVIDHDWVEACYRQAKRPAPEPVEVWPAARVREIEELLRRFEDWYAQRGG